MHSFNEQYVIIYKCLLCWVLYLLLYESHTEFELYYHCLKRIGISFRKFCFIHMCSWCDLQGNVLYEISSVTLRLCCL